jgi:RHS repeat-associated protein
LYDPDTRLTRFGARDYSAEMRQWGGRDPILFEGGDVNPYAYCGNDPVNCVDPSGLVVSEINVGTFVFPALGGGFGSGYAIGIPELSRPWTTPCDVRPANACTPKRYGFGLGYLNGTLVFSDDASLPHELGHAADWGHFMSQGRVGGPLGIQTEGFVSRESCERARAGAADQFKELVKNAHNQTQWERDGHYRPTPWR